MPASTAMPDITVEIAFATGPNDPAPVWVDVSAYLEAQAGIPISRGRPDELSTVQPSSCTVVLDNRDGRFTPGNTGSPYYPNVKKGRRIRVSATWPLSGSPVTYRRFSGYINEWPVAWPDETSAMSTVTITASSRLARLGRGVELRSIIEEEYLADSPDAYYTLGEPEGATVAGNTAATPQPNLAAAGSGAVPTFGTATGPGTDDLTAASFTGGKYLATTFTEPIVTASHTSFAMECFFSTASVSERALLRLSSGSGTGDTTEATVLKIETDGKLSAIGASFGIETYFIQTASSVADGATHHVVIRETISVGTLTASLYLDGTLIGTDTFALSAFAARSVLSVGGASFATFSGAIAHVAVTSGVTEMSAARIDAHSDSGLNGFSGEGSNARIARFAGYAGVPSAEVSVETGLSTSLTNQLTGGETALALMTEVVETESGVLFDAGNGNLVFHARSHRYNAASTLTLSATAGEIEAGLEPKLDDQGLVNDLTASRDGGVTVRAVNTASIADYGLYRESITLLTTSDNEVSDAANWKLGLGAEPQVRVPEATVDLLNCTSAQKTALLAREIGDRVTLANLPSQAPATSMDFFIEGYTETPGAESYTISFNLSPAALSGAWQLDSTTYSVLGTTTRLGY